MKPTTKMKKVLELNLKDSELSRLTVDNSAEIYRDNKGAVIITIFTKSGEFAIIRFIETKDRATATRRSGIVANLAHDQTVRLTVMETSSLDDVVDTIMQYVDISGTPQPRYDKDGFIRLTRRNRGYWVDNVDFNVGVYGAKRDQDSELLITLANIFATFGNRVNIRYSGPILSSKNIVSMRSGIPTKTILLVCDFLEEIGLSDKLVIVGTGMISQAIQDVNSTTGSAYCPDEY